MRTMLVYAALLAALVAVPAPSAEAGDGCNAGFGQYYANRTVYVPSTYYAPQTAKSFYYPPGFYPATVSSTNYVPAAQTTTCTTQTTAAQVCDQYGCTPVAGALYAGAVAHQPFAVPAPYVPETFFKVAPELAYGRINEEISAKAAQQAIERFKAELAAQEQKRFTEEAAKRQEAILSQLAAAVNGLAQQQHPIQVYAPPGTVANTETARLQAEIEQLKLYIQQMARPAASSQPQPQPPAIPPGAQSSTGGNAPAGDVLVAGIRESCLDCHNPSKAGRMNLSDLSKLTRAQLLEIEHRVISGDPKEVMPPPDSGKKPFDIKAVNVVHALINKAPR